MRPNDRLHPITILVVNADAPDGPALPLHLDPSVFRTVACTDDWERSIASQALYCDLIITRVKRSFAITSHVLRALRRDRCFKPIIAISVPEQRKRCIQLLDAGADDFVFEDIDRTELAARIAATLRKANYVGSAPKAAGVFSKGVAGRVDLTKLTLRDALVFQLLLAKRGAIVSKAEIEQTLYDGRIVESNAIESAIYALRRKLGRDIILTRRNLGYSLNLEIGSVAEGAA